MMGRGGSIILVASAMHYMGLANHSTYAATKAALRSYARTESLGFAAIEIGKIAEGGRLIQARAPLVVQNLIKYPM
jgi:NAD(P)-dependent dehydrogenase (short-subunit alcohol dehydrogenase family)